MENKKIEQLKDQVEAKREEISKLETTKEASKQELEDLTEALKQAEWQAKLDIIDTEIAPLFREVKEKENEFSRGINQFVEKLKPKMQDLNSIFMTIESLKGKMKDIETTLLHDGDRVKLQKTFKLKYDEIANEIEVEEKIPKYLAIIKYINSNLGLQEKMDKLFFRTRDNLSPSAFQIYSSVVDRGKQKPFRVRESDLLKFSQISETRIIDARDKLAQSLDELKNNSLITYERKGDFYNIQVARDSTERR
ncbi:MAG: hypothetical protein KAV83_05055 [Desulfobacterales bacterium]|nr:hypothetical protein [Desulfobacterales bacterium]